MLNDFVLTVIRGGYNYRLVRHYGYHIERQARDHLQRIVKRRLVRGYTLS